MEIFTLSIIGHFRAIFWQAIKKGTIQVMSQASNLHKAPKPDYRDIPEQFPPAWAIAYGQDNKGYWADFRVKEVVQRMRWIPAGWFVMGSPEGEKGRYKDETQYEVTLTQGYWLADTACTQALWVAAMGENPANFTDDIQNPVEQVSWDNTQVFFSQLNTQHESYAFSLPSEAQWEYACRAGTASSFSFGEELTIQKANYSGKWTWEDDKVVGEYRKKTLPVKAFDPNPWGLYQMHGNVWEWVQDGYGEYPTSPVLNPEGAESSEYRVLRGGSWFNGGLRVRSAFRLRGKPDYRSNFVGFRLSQVK